jgi:tetratricopeptide (TPR) repeat protein
LKNWYNYKVVKETEDLLKRAYETLKSDEGLSALDTVEVLLNQAVEADGLNEEAAYALKCSIWWKERFEKLEAFRDMSDRGGFLLSQWGAFYTFLERIDSVPYDNCLYAIRRFVFSSALAYFRQFQRAVDAGDSMNESGLLLQVGRCYKGLGDYDQALKYLKQAVSFKKDDGEALSEMADVCALLGDEQKAKALFREAFFTDPQRVDMRNMESDLVLRLKDKVEEQGYSGRELNEWMPVYGVIYGVFSVKRELKRGEPQSLRQSIITLEIDLKNKPEEAALLKPRLVNHYFWLIDHYENVNEDPGLIEQTLLKIKFLDMGLYERCKR